MRANGIKRIAFASTGSVCGEPEVFPTPETAPFPVQTSLYAASKLACEGLIQAYCEVNDSIGWITGHLGIDPVRIYTGGERGWIGDSPFIFLDTTKIRSLGWAPKLSIREGIIRTLDYLKATSWLMEERS